MSASLVLASCDTTMSESAGNGTNSDVITILTTDHQEMLELLGQIDGAPDADQRRDLDDAAIVEVMRHAVAEEMFVYPEMEKHFPNGTEDLDFRSFAAFGDRSCWSAVTAVVYVSGGVVGVSS